ncbi:LuxR C-terminal-related transcriptional regulator [Actinoplanes sp. NPDC049265]|uniref:LuxR C-terminal-related transcriptional regulator n=1 Tax=Actinoplanes sp. NPDC049265 TaxID=3363902 RepID=UPI00371FD0BB
MRWADHPGPAYSDISCARCSTFEKQSKRSEFRRSVRAWPLDWRVHLTSLRRFPGVALVIADDDALGLRLTRKVIGSHPEYVVIAETASVRHTIDVCDHRRPDVLVVSRSLLSGGEPTMTDLISRTEAVVVVVAIGASGAAVWQSMSSGASGYVLRDRLADDLPPALRAAETGNAFVSAPLTRQLIGYLSSRENAYDGPDPTDISRSLLPRERETLLRLAAGESTEEIASAMSVTTATVRSYVSRILRKLGVRSRGEAVAFAYRSRFYEPGPTPQARPGRVVELAEKRLPRRQIR